MSAVRSIPLIVALAAGLLLAPAASAAGLGGTISNGAESASCCDACCAIGQQDGCCSNRETKTDEMSSVPCGACPLGGCTCHCGCGTAGPVLALSPASIDLASVDLMARCELHRDQLTARSDEPLLPPPIG